MPQVRPQLVAKSAFTSTEWRQQSRALAHDSLPWDLLQDAHIVVTGGSGYLGSAVLAALVQINHIHRLNITMTGISRRDAPIGAAEHGIQWSRWDISTPAPSSLVVSDRPLWIIHGAAITSSRRMISEPLSVLDVAYAGTRNLLDWAAVHGAEKIIHISSIEAYGQTPSASQDEAVTLTEEILGELSLSDPRSCYPLGKRIAEHLCNLYMEERGIESLSIRSGPALGAGLPNNDSRVAARFISSAETMRKISIHSSGMKILNLIDTQDFVSGALYAALLGTPGQTYNIGNPCNHPTVLEFAERVAEACSLPLGAIEHAKRGAEITGFAADTRQVLSIEKMRSMGWAPRVPLTESIQRVRRFWREPASQ